MHDVQIGDHLLYRDPPLLDYESDSGMRARRQKALMALWSPRSLVNTYGDASCSRCRGPRARISSPCIGCTTHGKQSGVAGSGDPPPPSTAQSWNLSFLSRVPKVPSVKGGHGTPWPNRRMFKRIGRDLACLLGSTPR